MPIVISDDLLTPESIQNMPVVLSEEVQKIPEKTSGAIIKKAVSSISPKQQVKKCNYIFMNLIYLLY